MSYRDEPRLQLVADILAMKRNSSRAFVQYLTETHEYGQGEVLHMREAHFITAMEPGTGKPMSEIAKSLCVTHGAVSQIAGRLEKKGYIIRQRDPENHRVVHALLTPKGEAFYQEHLAYDSEQFAEVDRSYLSRFTDEELRLIREYETLSYAIFTKANQSK